MNSVSSFFPSAIASRNKSLQDTLLHKHMDYFVERGILLVWALANARSVTAVEATELLGFTAKSDGIWFEGVNGVGQFRPDTRWKNDKGKLVGKFLSPLRTVCEIDIFIPNHPTDSNYWEIENLKKACYQINDHPHIVTTEGPAKAIAGCAKNIPTVAVSGVENGLTGSKKDPEGKRFLVPTLRKLAEAGLGFITAYDADVATNPNVATAERTLAAQLGKFKVPVRTVTGKWVTQIEGKDTKGMDDFIQHRGIEEFRAILCKAKLFGETESQGEPPDTGDSKPKSKSRNKYLLDKIEAHWGERLRLNEMSQQIELNGRAGELNVERAYARLARELALDIPKQVASDFVAEIAEKYSYSPVRDYLNSLVSIEPINLETLAERYFGTSDPLHATLLKRTLIAAVARVFEPGCKHDTLCILQGGQGTFKSTFWQTLASDAWFTDNLSEGNEKDEKLKLRRYWILEFSEFETAYKRKEIEQLKAFLSSRIDSLRRPYGRAIEDFPRTSIFVGTTNRQEILHDPTGERRYLVIPVLQSIPIKIVEEERDRIWAAAVAAYKAGEQWWLTPEEDKLLAEANQDWQSTDTWEEDVLKYVENRAICTIGEILEKPLGIDIGQHGKGEQMRVSDILRRNGWMKSKQKRIDGKVQRYWERVVTEVVTEVVKEVVTAQNLYSITTLESVSPPVTTSFQNNSQNANSNVEASETEKTQAEKSLENEGGDTDSNKPENLSPQGSPPVTTSPKQGGDSPKSPQCPETAINKHQAGKLANQMREAIANGDSAEAKEIWKKFENIPLSQRGQQHQFFWKALTPDECRKARLLIFTNVMEGQQLKYVGSTEQYQGIELTAYDADSHNGVTVTCRKPDGYLTTGLKPKDLKKL
jgi:predicted P-loop ATPase